MVDTDFLKVYKSYDSLPKLNVEDVTAAVLYALSTSEYVQVNNCEMFEKYDYITLLLTKLIYMI